MTSPSAVGTTAMATTRPTLCQKDDQKTESWNSRW